MLELEVVFGTLDGHPIIDILDRLPNAASPGHAIDCLVRNHSIPSYPMVVEMVVFEVAVLALHAIVPAIVPSLDASVVSVQPVFVPHLSPDQVALPIAALEVLLGLGSWPLEVDTLVVAMVVPVLVLVAVAVLALP